MDKEGRVLYLDYLKAFGIILVICYHCSYIPFNFLFIEGAYAMCVPIFFMVNGYLMLRKERSIHDMILKNGKLLVVLFSWAFISTAVSMFCYGEWNSVGLIQGCKVLFYRSVFFRNPYSNHLWFLKVIFVLNLLNPIFYSFLNKKRQCLYLLIILGLCTVRFFDKIVGVFTNPLGKWWEAFALFYYVLGYVLLSGKYLQRFVKINIVILILLILVAVILQWGYNWVFLDGYLSELNQAKKWITDVVWDGYKAPFIVCLTSLVVLLFQRIRWRGCRFIQFIGQYSLAIYVMQSPIQRLWEMVLPLGEWMNFIPSIRIVLPILTLLSCLALTKLFLTNKYTAYLINF